MQLEPIISVAIVFVSHNTADMADMGVEPSNSETFFFLLTCIQTTFGRPLGQRTGQSYRCKHESRGPSNDFTRWGCTGFVPILPRPFPKPNVPPRKSRPAPKRSTRAATVFSPQARNSTLYWNDDYMPMICRARDYPRNGKQTPRAKQHHQHH